MFTFSYQLYQKRLLYHCYDSENPILVTFLTVVSILLKGPPRTSSLHAPIMQLSGHQGEVFVCKFHPEGETLASSGHDRQLFVWNTFGDCENVAALLGHKGAVLDLCYSSDGSNIFTASTDQSIGMWDTKTLARTKKLKGHTGIVNAVDSSKKSSSGGQKLIVTGSDDCTIKLWDTRIRRCINTHEDGYQILAVSFNGSSDQVIYSGIENVVKVFDLRKNSILYNLVGHFDSVTGLSLSPDGSFILSNSMDNTLCIWDIRPFVTGQRLINTLHGHSHNFEKNLLRCSWSPDGTKVSSGSADRNVYIWDAQFRRILYKLPGHQGSVNDVQFHPIQPISKYPLRMLNI